MAAATMENWGVGVLEWCIVAGLLHFVYGTEELPSAHTDSSVQVTSRFPGNHRMEAGKPVVSAVPWFGFATAAEESGLYNSKLCPTAVSVGAIDPKRPGWFGQPPLFKTIREPIETAPISSRTGSPDAAGRELKDMCPDDKSWFTT